MKSFKQIMGIQPRYIVVISLILIFALFTSALIELSHTKKEIHGLMEQEATTLLEAISISGANAIYSFQEIEALLEQKLLTVARLTDQLDKVQQISSEKLAEIAASNNVLRINIYKNSDKKITSSYTENHDTSIKPFSNIELLQPILNGNVNELVLGIIDSRHEGEKRFAVAVKRTKGGVIVVNVDAKDIIEFRKEIGVGKLMQDIGDYEGLEYIVLQDFEGILIASSAVNRMNSLESDLFLLDAYNQKKLASRFTKYNDQKIFEFVGPFILDNEPVGLFRIGLKTDHLDQSANRIKRRLIIMSVVMGFFIIIVFNFVTINQNYRIINQAYQKIQTYSQNILEHMADAVIAIDHKNMTTIFNRAASVLFNQNAEQVIQKSIQETISLQIPELKQALETGTTIHDIEKTIEIDNQKYIASISTSIVKNEKGEIDTAFAVIKDLTEKHYLLDNLKRQEKLTAMGQLASGVAHEIRNPLNSISMISQRLNKEFKPKSDEKEYLQLTKSMVSEVRRINEIIRQFLQFARPPKLNLTATNINELIDSTALFVSSQAQEKNIKIEKDLENAPSLILDRNQMKQVILNLILNSMDAIENEGAIYIHTFYKNSEVIIEINDNGIGIDNETISKIFNLYFTTKPTGTGLGLSVVHQIISQHNGRIEVESELQKGTKFTIYLPV